LLVVLPYIGLQLLLALLNLFKGVVHDEDE
jgi:hypothetical protein